MTGNASCTNANTRSFPTPIGRGRAKFVQPPTSADLSQCSHTRDSNALRQPPAPHQTRIFNSADRMYSRPGSCSRRRRCPKVREVVCKRG
ncbi:hypothetical protein M407DRAFT_94225 [Tulasnella calospora MUT 4182]|uniref:Uncharacterized protein n=1 Tax=Tulasnella calospora MUT 4182 TaxID=1051891 RepID=A0A0C3QFW8_9AGAM|nr:hypothetical protein M407DRAFT_94225 [Tulasnella calospora MUT 4182]